MAGEDNAYRAYVRGLSCVVAPHGCTGGIEAHHAGNDRGLGQRADDSTCIPLCLKHHTEWHAASGPFKTMKKQERRDWAKSAIERTQKQYADSRWPGEWEIPF